MAAVAAQVVETLEGAGAEPQLLDLYADGFSPTGADVATVVAHQEALSAAGALVLVYPTWWSGLPAMLTGWLEHVVAGGSTPRPGRPETTAASRELLANLRYVAAVTTSRLLEVGERRAGRGGPALPAAQPAPALPRELPAEVAGLLRAPTAPAWRIARRSWPASTAGCAGWSSSPSRRAPAGAAGTRTGRCRRGASRSPRRRCRGAPSTGIGAGAAPGEVATSVAGVPGHQPPLQPGDVVGLGAVEASGAPTCPRRRTAAAGPPCRSGSGGAAARSSPPPPPGLPAVAVPLAAQSRDEPAP